MSRDLSDTLSIATMSLRAPLMANAKTRQQLISAFFVAVLGHTVVMLALAAALEAKIGE